MKKFNKIFLSLALVLILALPMLAGCDLFNNNSTTKESLKIHTNFKTEYEIGETLDLTDEKIQYTDEQGEKTVVAITTTMVSGFSTETAGSRQLIITYQGKTLLVDYTVYRVYDMEVNALYYCHPSQMVAMENALYGSNRNVNEYYDYIQFSSSNSTGMTSTQKDPQTFLQESGFATYMTCTSSKENHKKTYTMTTPNGAVIKVTVVNENTLHLTATSGSENVENYEMNFVKYVA